MLDQRLTPSVDKRDQWFSRWFYFDDFKLH